MQRLLPIFFATTCALHAAEPAPSNVRITESSPAHLRVEWDGAAKGESGFRIWRR